MSRHDELEGYRRAADYSRNKGFNTVILNNNTEIEMQENLNSIRNLIMNIAERNK